MGVADVQDHNLDLIVGRFPLDNIAIVILKLQLLEIFLHTAELSSLIAHESNDVLLRLILVVAELGDFVADKTFTCGKNSSSKGQKTGDGECSPHFEL